MGLRSVVISALHSKGAGVSKGTEPPPPPAAFGGILGAARAAFGSSVGVRPWANAFSYCLALQCGFELFAMPSGKSGLDALTK